MKKTSWAAVTLFSNHFFKGSEEVNSLALIGTPLSGGSGKLFFLLASDAGL